MLDEEIRVVVGILKRILQQEHLTAEGMARRLGISPGHLSMVFSGKRRPGIRFLRAAMARFPEVRRVLQEQFERAPEPRRKNTPRRSRGG